MWFFSNDEELLEQIVTIANNYDAARAKVPRAREAARSKDRKVLGAVDASGGVGPHRS